METNYVNYDIYVQDKRKVLVDFDELAGRLIVRMWLELPNSVDENKKRELARKSLCDYFYNYDRSGEYESLIRLPSNETKLESIISLIIIQANQMIDRLSRSID